MPFKFTYLDRLGAKFHEWVWCYPVAWIGPHLGRLLTRERIRFVCLAVLAFVAMLSAASFLTADRGRTVLGPELAPDFAGFYAAGTILNEQGPGDLYDLELQDRVYHRLFPAIPTGMKLPFVHPPFFAALIRPLALLPYPSAFLVWLLVMTGLYLAGFSLVLGSCERIATGDRWIALLLGLSFHPFAFDCLLGGQASSIGFLAMAVALLCERSGLHFGLGLALGLCLYKPPLLLLIIPLLAVARRWRALVGFAATGLVLVSLSLLAVGLRGCLAYIRLLASFSRIRRGPGTGFPTWKFVDMNSSLHQLLGDRSPLANTLIPVCALVFLLPLARMWWSLGRTEGERRDLLWACTLSWTPIVNVYFGIYDTILVLLGVLLTTDGLYRRASGPPGTLPSGFRSLLALLYLVPWFTQHLALRTGFQAFSLVLVALGSYQFRLTGTPLPGSRAGDLAPNSTAELPTIVRGATL